MRYVSLSALAVVATVAFSGALSGCDGTDSTLITGADISVSDNLEVVHVGAIFSSIVQSDLSGMWAVKDYGSLFITPYTNAHPFEIGFDLNTKILYDTDYADPVKFRPTEVLPNGAPIGISYALAEVKDASPISSKFDIYGYVDVAHQSWLGAAAIFTFLTDKYFPADLSLNKILKRDNSGNPSVIAYVFGPTLDGQGQLVRAGGIAIFANVKSLIQHTTTISQQTRENVHASGAKASQYEGHLDRMHALEINVIKGLNGQSL
ncbi:MAG: hypothetical protein ACXWPM_02515 [Bdellovibrionota bacterium]